MLLKKDARRHWQVLLLNVAVVVAFGLVALTLPYLTKSGQSASGTSGEVSLVCHLVKPDKVADYYCWQVYQVQNGKSVKDWATIYQEYVADNSTLVVSHDLQITKDGLIYTGEDVRSFTGWVRYQGQQVVVRL